jgi:TldD protein
MATSTSSGAPALRAQSGEKTGFAYADEVQFETLLQAAKAARAIARGGGEGRVKLEGSGYGPAPLRAHRSPR